MMFRVFSFVLPIALTGAASSPSEQYFSGAGKYEAKFDMKGGKGLKDTAYARAYNISDPVFTCTKPGYVLKGEDCIFTDTVAVRLECPIGFTPDVPGAPTKCTRVTPATPSSEVNAEGLCVTSTLTSPVNKCPPGTNPVMTSGGLQCESYQSVPLIEKCPYGSERISGQCIEIIYEEPAYVCPSNSTQEGKKCRKETMVFKTKGRQLEATSLRRNLGTEEDLMDDDEIEIDLFADLVIPNEEGEASLSGEKSCKGDSCSKSTGTWMPAQFSGVVPTKAPKIIYTEALKWQKIHVQVPVMVPQKNPATKPPKSTTTPAPKIKVTKVKVSKVTPPQKIIKVQYLPAEKICEEGERHGNHCVIQIAHAPVTECPVALINGICQKKTISAPIGTCPTGTLVCPPLIAGTSCQCQILTTSPPTYSCPYGGALNSATQECVSYAAPKEYCPLGYFLDSNGTTCTKRDVEPALCMFSVTYLCPDCEKY